MLRVYQFHHSGGTSSLSLGIDSEVAPELGHVAVCLDVVLRYPDPPLFVDDERRADHALDGLAVQLLLAEGAVGVSACRSGSDSRVIVRPSRSRNLASFSGWSGEIPSTGSPPPGGRRASR